MSRILKFALIVAVLAILTACGGGGGGGGGGGDLDLKTQIVGFSVTASTDQSADSQLSDSFLLSADFNTPNLTNVDYDSFVRVTNDLQSSPGDANSYDIFNGKCLGGGDCSYRQRCSIFNERNTYYFKCDDLPQTNIDNIVSGLPATLFFEIAACSVDGCNFEYQHLTIEQDYIIDNNIYFINSENAVVNEKYQSNTITISGLNTEVNININKGVIVKNGNDLVGNSSTVVNGDKISVKLESASSIGITEFMDVTIGGVTLTYSVTTGGDLNAGFPLIDNGIYNAVGNNFYYLTMPSAGNIDFTADHIAYSNVKVYDLSMNELDSFSSKTINLSAGSYIVKIYNEYYDRSVSIYSPVMTDPMDLPQLSNGTYSEVDTNFYYLTMPSAGNIDFTADHIAYSNIKVYDLSMNELDSFSSKTVNLQEGSYIVKIFNEYYDRSVTVYSPLL